MKHSHRDFRPPRRSRYVSRPPKRRPTLRILLLGLLGLAVYLKFDAVVRLPFWKSFRNPGAWLSARMHPATLAPSPSPVVLNWDNDSAHVKAACPIQPSLCLGAGFPLGPEPAGQVREILGKAEALWDAHANAGFTATFARSRDLASAESHWDLERLELPGAPRPLRLDRDASRGEAVFCAEGRCLDDLRPRMPLAVFRSTRELRLPAETTDPGLPRESAPAVRFQAANGAGVTPILRGRVIAIPAAGDSLGWLELHHGRNLFSFYRGIARMGASVRAGALVEPGDTLGWIAGDSAAVELRIESGGRPLDPLAFLGLPAAPEEPLHVR